MELVEQNLLFKIAAAIHVEIPAQVYRVPNTTQHAL
jgi:hypothetical protein